MTDETLAEQTRRGRGTAYAVLVARHCDAIYAIAGNMCATSSEAEDVTRRTFLSAYRHLGSCPTDGPFRIWLYGIAVKTALAERPPVPGGAAGSLEPLLPRFDAEGLMASSAAEWPELDGSRGEQERVTALLREALDCIDDAVRAAFVLCDLVELPAAEAAAILQTSPEVVRERVHRARLTIRGFLDQLWKDR